MYKISMCTKYHLFRKISRKKQIITYLDVKLNIMLILNCLRALNKVKKMAPFKVRSPIEIPSTPRSGIG